MGLFWQLFRKLKGGLAPKTRSNPVAIAPDAAMSKDATEDAIEVERLVEARIVSSGLFIPDKIPDLMGRLRIADKPFQRLSIDSLLGGKFLLTVGEKRALGLNTRMKYTREFVEFFEPRALSTIEPKSLLSGILHAAFFEVARARSLARFEEAGVGFVKIQPLGDPDCCAAVKRLRKQIPIESVPKLPLPNCTAEVCRCTFEL
ncbi:hypothetical protein [Burkholderia multivorans]|uniref:hypothetical protein n=1 Tax=Burkholderia multivorans TaxID=87883 RepID=UPI00158E3FCB|nr:hypothetical protein [Burkholderia multivorans]